MAQETNNLKVDQLLNACGTSIKKDKICQALVMLKTIGDDSIEIIKEYVDLSPNGYAMLTATNWIITGRIRVRSKSFFYARANHIYDIQKDSTSLIFELSF